jgi:hypothetical protein
MAAGLPELNPASAHNEHLFVQGQGGSLFKVKVEALIDVVTGLAWQRLWARACGFPAAGIIGSRAAASRTPCAAARAKAAKLMVGRVCRGGIGGRRVEFAGAEAGADSLKAAGVTRIFAEKISTRAVTRPELDRAVALARGPARVRGRGHPGRARAQAARPGPGAGGAGRAAAGRRHRAGVPGRRAAGLARPVRDFGACEKPGRSRKRTRTGRHSLVAG